MRNLILSLSILLFTTLVFSQVKVTNGPDLESNSSNNMNRLLGGDDKSFYCYRVRSKGKGTSYYIEKYDKASMKLVFSKEVEVDPDRLTYVKDVYFAMNTVFVFVCSYDKEKQKMTLYYEKVTSDGEVINTPKKIMGVTSDHYEFVDFEIFPNPSATKFLIKAVHKAKKADTYRTDFLLLGADEMTKIWKKTVEEKIGNLSGGYFSFWGGGGSSNGSAFIGLYVDDSDNVCYATARYEKDPEEGGRQYKAEVSILKSESDEPEVTALTFDDDFLVQDVSFSKTAKGDLVVGGFLKDVIERKGRDDVRVGIFSFVIKMSDGRIVSQRVKMFGKKLLAALQADNNQTRYYRYKLDYMIPVGDDVFYVGEQFEETEVTTYDSKTGRSSTRYIYNYMDVIVAKLNANGDFEWIKNSLMRNSIVLNYPHVFKQYIAVPTANSIVILNNENAKNLEIAKKPDFQPKNFKSMSGIHGSNFVYTTIDTSDGAKKRGLVFNNKTYCFAPIQERNPQFMPPSNTEIFINGEPNEVYIYTENKGKDRFARLNFE